MKNGTIGAQRMLSTIQLDITGVVQGVGFRPFIYNLAVSLGIRGYVTNTSTGVRIVASGDRKTLKQFKDHIATCPPARAAIDTIEETHYTGNDTFSSFSIQKSKTEKTKFTRISPDLMVCDDCIREMLDPGNRRYYYPYINCTNCGPRYTITGDVPYDRPFTTMARFTMCPACRAEYNNPGDRRFHAQPNACHDCGPHLSLLDSRGEIILSPGTGEEYVSFFLKIAELIKQGYIIAVKGIGGFHLVCDAENEKVVCLLRKRKYREYKPFAVMVKTIAMAESCAFLHEDEKNRLRKGDRAILLLPGKEKSPIAPSVAPSTHIIGIMLPYTPFHFLLFEHLETPLVMTSANISEEPIVHTNGDALSRLQGIADFYITGNREILIRCDDSVTRIWQGKDYFLRRSRGIVPSPLFLHHTFKQNILALGASQKNTICLGKANQAILSHHIGDLDDERTFESFCQAIRHLSHVFDCKPGVIAHDLHPQYVSTRFALDPPSEFLFIKKIKHTGIQHHHAHIVSCMADNNITGKVIGIALDGTGYGPDNTIWGGEILLADEKEYRRIAALSPVPMPGGEAAIRKPWRMALSCLYHVYGENWESHIPAGWKDLNQDEIRLSLYQIKEGINAPLTSSCGRLFDSIAALCGLRFIACYEGQPAIELEQQIDKEYTSSYEFEINAYDDLFLITFHNVINQVLSDVNRGISTGEIAAQFHNGLINILHNACCIAGNKTGIDRVVLSGGCFMNMYLLEGVYMSLVSSGFKVYIHNRIPCNDGGISLGQAVIADHRE
ncbi:MAG: carbamoyltransferase HypF [Spirochaetales bacterium]|nr:carbamoyltransferase HypF [Spirochaetales bacterium]